MTPPQQHLSQDPILANLISTLPAPEITSTQNVFHDLLSCILEQQIHYRSTKRIFQRMLERAAVAELTPENFEQFEAKAFEGIKLSMKKYETVHNIAQHWATNRVNYIGLSDGEVRKSLGEIKGVGKWTIDMILIYTLGRPDVFAYDDFHIKQIMTSLYELDAKAKLRAQMIETSAPWSPYKSTAFLYLLEWKKQLKLQKGKT